jgi:hypothetical protein
MNLRAVMAAGVVIAIAVAVVVVFAKISGPSTACYAMTDGPAIDKMIEVYNRMPATSRGDPSEMALSRARVIGIGRDIKPKDSGKSIIQAWFKQDDQTVTVATLSQTCELNFRPGLDVAAMNDANYPTHPAKY